MNTLENARFRRVAPRAGILLPLACALVVSAGCAPRVDLKRMAYEALRREDCRLNRIDEFCQRNFAREYVEYERLRQRFMRDSIEPVAPGSESGQPDGGTR